ncbi:Uncharacterised protein [Yersinia intermedia]|nr:Uncharacterised protein [Yersinia intermedia]
MKRLKLSTEILVAIIITLFAMCMIVYVVGDSVKGVH